jgi:hypothetical protein
VAGAAVAGAAVAGAVVAALLPHAPTMTAIAPMATRPRVKPKCFMN